MKELSIEQKAQRYDEAIERAKNHHDNNGLTLEQYQTIDIIFPELKESKESEDERIRKEIIDFIYDKTDTFELREKSNSWLAWLEKQGTPAKLSEEEQNKFAKGVLTSCALSFIDYLDAHKHEGKMCVSNGECEDIENAFHNAMWDRLHRYYCKYIEKQGEQKLADTDNKFIRMRETKPKDISEFLDRLTTVEQEFLWEHIAKIRELDKEKQSENKETLCDKCRKEQTSHSCQDITALGRCAVEHEQKPYGQRKECLDCQFNYAGECKGSCAMKRSEQESTWSEEDENRFNNLIFLVECSDENEPTKEGFIKFINRLKSLKNRVQH